MTRRRREYKRHKACGKRMKCLLNLLLHQFISYDADDNYPTCSTVQKNHSVVLVSSLSRVIFLMFTHTHSYTVSVRLFFFSAMPHLLFLIYITKNQELFLTSNLLCVYIVVDHMSFTFCLFHQHVCWFQH
jgi:hypothetical protein